MTVKRTTHSERALSALQSTGICITAIAVATCVGACSRTHNDAIPNSGVLATGPVTNGTTDGGALASCISRFVVALQKLYMLPPPLAPVQTAASTLVTATLAQATQSADAAGAALDEALALRPDAAQQDLFVLALLNFVQAVGQMLLATLEAAAAVMLDPAALSPATQSLNAALNHSELTSIDPRTAITALAAALPPALLAVTPAITQLPLSIATRRELMATLEPLSDLVVVASSRDGGAADINNALVCLDGSQ